MRAARLPQILSLFDLVVLAGASMGPAFSLATTMGPMVAAAGTLAPLALVLLTAVMTCVAIAFARMVRVMPNAGSSYSWIRTAFGHRIGAYGAWLLILANFFAVLTTALPAGTYTLDLFAPQLAASSLPIALVGSAWIVVGAIVLWIGLRPTSRIAAILLLGECVVLVVTAFAAAVHAPVAAAHAASGNAGLGGIVVAMAIGIWMTDGWEVTASTSEESRGGRALPGAGGIIGLLTMSALLLACMVAYMRVGTTAAFAEHTEDTLAYVGTQLGSGTWSVVVEATVLVSIMAALQATLVYLSRSVYAMGRDGVLPAPIGRLDRRGTPAASIALVTLFVVVSTLVTGFSQSARDAYTVVLNGSAVFLGALFLFSTAAAVRTFVMQRKEWVMGVIVPSVASVALTVILVAAVVESDLATRTFIVGGALLGLPVAAWRA
jgi:amino acid transporter